MKSPTSASLRIPIYNKKGVEIQITSSNGKITLDITNSSGLPRLVALANVWSSSSTIRPTIVQLGAHCVRKLPWSLTDRRRLERIEVKVCDSVEDSLDVLERF